MNILKNISFASKSIKLRNLKPNYLPAFHFTNYYRPQNLQRFHGRLRYDENSHIKTDELLQEVCRIVTMNKLNRE